MCGGNTKFPFFFTAHLWRSVRPLLQLASAREQCHSLSLRPLKDAYVKSATQCCCVSPSTLTVKHLPSPVIQYDGAAGAEWFQYWVIYNKAQWNFTRSEMEIMNILFGWLFQNKSQF
jgi:hypothetical protein